MLLANFTIFGLSVVIGLNYGLTARALAASQGSRPFLGFAPSFVFYQLLFGLTLTALFFQHVYNGASASLAPALKPSESPIAPSQNSISLKNSFLLVTLGATITAVIAMFLAIVIIGGLNVLLQMIV